MFFGAPNDFGSLFDEQIFENHVLQCLGKNLTRKNASLLYEDVAKAFLDKKEYEFNPDLKFVPTLETSKKLKEIIADLINKKVIK